MLEPREGEQQNVRNLVAHSRHVDGGNLGISRGSPLIDSPEYKRIEVRLIGGGEGLFPWSYPGAETSRTDDGIATLLALTPVLFSRFDRIVVLVRNVYDIICR